MAKRSRNFDDMPILGGIIFVIACVMFNIFAITQVLERVGIFDVEFQKKYKFPFALVLVGIILGYYLFKGRYKKIIEKYDQYKKRRLQLHPIIVIIIYYGISFGLLLLAGLYKNRDWIFAI
ncbi:MAG: hypothetical protein MI739_11515 [Bacteroidales bacterium]|nr:hypothetical protein [Bacteroidales bacterium]